MRSFYLIYESSLLAYVIINNGIVVSINNRIVIINNGIVLVLIILIGTDRVKE